MSLLPVHSEAGLQLGIGVKSPNVYLPFNKEGKDSNDKWIHSMDVKRGALHLRDIQTLTQNTLENASDSIAASFSDEPTVPSFPADREGVWNRIWDTSRSTKLLKDVDMEHSPTLEHGAKAVTDRFYIPTSLVSNIAKAEMSMTSDDGHRNVSKSTRTSSSHTVKDFRAIDPTKKRQIAVAQILTTMDARLDKEPYTLLMSIRGKTESELSIQLLMANEDTNLFEIKGKATVINLNSRIKHIEIPALSKSLGKITNLFAVITNRSLHVIRLDKISIEVIDVTQFQPLEFMNFEQFPLVDIAFNPWNIMEFAVIDSKGNWSLGKLETHKKSPCVIKLLKSISGSIFDPTEISPWNHVEWANDHSTLVLLNRSKLVELNYLADWQMEIVEAKTWSELRDYKRIDDSLALLLTSKEIILLQTDEKGIHRLISWKHNWDFNDSSIRISFKVTAGVQREKSIYVVMFSKLTLKVYAICLRYEDKIWIVDPDPSLLSVGHVRNKDGLNSVEFPDIESTGESDTDIVCITGFIGSETVVQGFLSTIKCEKNLSQEETRKCSTYNRDSLLNFSKLFEKALPSKDPTHNPETEYQIFQEYGYQLSEHLNKEIEIWKGDSRIQKLHTGCLADFKQYPSYFENLTEYASLLSQLSSYYTEHEIEFHEKSFVNQHLVDEYVSDWDELFNKLVISWDSVSQDTEILSKGIIEDVSLYLTVFQHTKSLDQTLRTVNNELPQGLRNIFDSWDADIESHSTMIDSHIQSFPSSMNSQQFQIPTIKSSQSAKKKKRPTAASKFSNLPSSQPPASRSAVRQSQGLPANLAPAFSLGSQATSSQGIPTLSQADGSQRHKRKKKKVGGFN